MKKILDEFNKSNSTIYKLNVLETHKTNPLLQRVLKLALDKVRYNFYIKKIPNAIKGHTTMSLEDGLDFLEYTLSGRVLTGNSAIQALAEVLGKLSDDDGYIIERILDRDLKIGLGKTQVNKIIKNLISDIPYARCDQYNKKTSKNIQYPAFCQLKADGSFANIFLETNEIISRSGNNKDFLGVFDGTFSEIKTILNDLTQDTDWVIHGEILYRGSGDRSVGNGIVNKADKGTIKITEAENCYFQLWDLIPHKDFINGYCNIPYEERFELLGKVVSLMVKRDYSFIELIPSIKVNTLQEALDITSEWMSQGYEGSILKSKGHKWEDKTMKTQLKLKLVIEADVRITGFTQGNGKYASTFGAIMFETDDGLVKGQCSGISDSIREEINQNKDVLIGSIMAVKCNDITRAKDSDTYALSHPRYEKIREDKTESDTLQRILDNKQMAIELGKK